MESTAPTTKQSVPFVPYLEGLRGLAALYVVLFHVRQYLEPNYASFGPSTALLPFRGQFLMYGHYAVGVFIVISGFVLTLPVAVRGALPGGWPAFFRRRARRLFPAYYAALTLAVPLYLYHIEQEHAHTTFKAVLGQYVAHALFIHDFAERTIFNIDGPMWSVAVEIQIYVAFVFVLLPVFRKAGITASIAVAFAIGCMPTLYGALRHFDPYPLEYACFWFLGLFALGSAAAFIAYDSNYRYDALLNRVPWKLLSLVMTAWFVWAVIPVYNDPQNRQSLPRDIVLGLAVSSAFIAIAKDQLSGRRSFVASLLSWRPFVALGTFSYSLYLIHFPIVLVVMTATSALLPTLKVSIAFLVLVPALLLLAFYFAKLFEFPYVSSRRREADRAIIQPEHSIVPRMPSVSGQFTAHDAPTEELLSNARPAK